MKFAHKLIIVAAIILALFIGWKIYSSNSSSDYDEFAQCLTDNGMKMYGAFWCSHCIEQKKEFGSSMKYINYIECSTPDGKSQLPVCAAAGVKSYPTWEVPGGKLQAGKLSFQELAAFSGCSLPA